MTLRDGKGRRSHARTFQLPLLGFALEAVEESLAVGRPEGPHVFSTDGARPLWIDTVSKVAQRIEDAMLKAGEATSTFQLRDVRRGVETLLAAQGVSRETRARLLSHGLGNVQDQHYDRHHYAPEIRSALEGLHRTLTQPVSPEQDNVLPMRKRRTQHAAQA